MCPLLHFVIFLRKNVFTAPQYLTHNEWINTVISFKFYFHFIYINNFISKLNSSFLCCLSHFLFLHSLSIQWQCHKTETMWMGMCALLFIVFQSESSTPNLNICFTTQHKIHTILLNRSFYSSLKNGYPCDRLFVELNACSLIV